VANAPINAFLGLPSPSGNNHLVFNGNSYFADDFSESDQAAIFWKLSWPRGGAAGVAERRVPRLADLSGARCSLRSGAPRRFGAWPR